MIKINNKNIADLGKTWMHVQQCLMLDISDKNIKTYYNMLKEWFESPDFSQNNLYHDERTIETKTKKLLCVNYKNSFVVNAKSYKDLAERLKIHVHTKKNREQEMKLSWDGVLLSEIFKWYELFCLNIIFSKITNLLESREDILLDMSCHPRFRVIPDFFVAPTSYEAYITWQNQVEKDQCPHYRLCCKIMFLDDFVRSCRRINILDSEENYMRMPLNWYGKTYSYLHDHDFNSSYYTELMIKRQLPLDRGISSSSALMIAGLEALGITDIPLALLPWVITTFYQIMPRIRTSSHSLSETLLGAITYHPVLNYKPFEIPQTDPISLITSSVSDKNSINKQLAFMLEEAIQIREKHICYLRNNRKEELLCSVFEAQFDKFLKSENFDVAIFKLWGYLRKNIIAGETIDELIYSVDAFLSFSLKLLCQYKLHFNIEDWKEVNKVLQDKAKFLYQLNKRNHQNINNNNDKQYLQLVRKASKVDHLIRFGLFEAIEYTPVLTPLKIYRKMSCEFG